MMAVLEEFQCNIALQGQLVWQYEFQIGSHQKFLLSQFGFPLCCIQIQNFLQVDVSEHLLKADIWLLTPLLIWFIFIPAVVYWRYEQIWLGVNTLSKRP